MQVCPSSLNSVIQQAPFCLSLRWEATSQESEKQNKTQKKCPIVEAEEMSQSALIVYPKGLKFDP